jgi:lysozyme family protein
MVASTFDTVAFPFMLGSEGGFDDDPRDRGNWTDGAFGKKGGVLKGTKYGIASHVYPELDIKNLTVEQARAIYKRDYAAKVAYDQMPAGVDVSVYDMGVNAGPSRSMALLKGALGASSASAAALAQAATLSKDKIAVIKGFSAKRLAFYKGLSTFKTYGRGWTRRAAECEAISVKTWLTYGARKSTAEVKKTLEIEGKAATKSSAGNATAGTTATGTETVNASQHDWSWSLDWATVGHVVLAIVVIGIVVFFVRKALVHRERAAAYAKTANETF